METTRRENEMVKVIRQEHKRADVERIVASLERDRERRPTGIGSGRTRKDLKSWKELLCNGMRTRFHENVDRQTIQLVDILVD